jgi:hypothetical protein
LLNKIIYWFSLESAVLGKKGTKRQIVLFTGVVAGTVGQWLFAALGNGKFAWQGLVLGFIASVVTFPVIFYNAGLNKGGDLFIKWCVAFQNGFFWPTLLEQVGKGFQR